MGTGLKGVGKMLLGVFADLAIQLGTLAIGYGIAIDAIKLSLATLAGPNRNCRRCCFSCFGFR